MDETYSNIRELIGTFIGRTITDITQHDADEFLEDGLSYVQLHFPDGSWLKFYIMDEEFGFVSHEENSDDQ